MKFVQLAKSLGELAPIYLIDGEEAYFRDLAVKQITAACGITRPALNDVRIEGETLKGDRLVSFRTDLYTLPFLDGRRLVRVYDFYPSERDWAQLSPYAESPCPSTVLLIVNGGKRANAADLRRKKGLTLVDCARESEEALSKWLFGMLKRKGLSADIDALTLMVRYCSFDAARMAKECEKLALYLGEGGRVTGRVVEEQKKGDGQGRRGADRKGRRI